MNETVTITIDGVTTTLTLSARTFSTGSTGYSANGKAQGTDGRRYQVSVNAVLIGSKPTA